MIYVANVKEKLKLHYSLAWAMVKPHEKTAAHKLNFAEVYYIIKGSGRISINNEERLIKAHDTVYIPPDVVQFVENIGDENLEFLCIVDPAWRQDAERIIDRDN